MENLRTLYLYDEAASMKSGALPGSQAGVADMFEYNQDKQDWYPAGYWLWNVGSLQEAIDWAKKCPGDDVAEFNMEIRPFFEPEDFAGIASDEMIAEEQNWRDEQAKHAPKALA